ncbi:MAG: Insulinase family protein [Ignavibacteria bacterium]|nr:Insulinase family protein [Ignavibacteria bacterium]
MKRFIYLFIIIIFAYNGLIAQNKLDVTKKPEPLNEKTFSFPVYTQKQLSNGLKVFIIEDHEQAVVGINILIPGGSSTDGAQPGLANLLNSILTKGAAKRSALDIAEELDGVGASISATADGDYSNIYASTLLKHLPLVLEVLTDILTEPTFPQDELEKLKAQVLAQLQYEKSDPGTIAAILSRKAIYGENHPYSKKPNEASINPIQVQDLKNYYSKYFIPNNSTIAIIGDVKPEEIITQLEETIAKWKPGTAQVIQIPPAKSMPLGVYFVQRPGSVQSTVILTTLTVPYKDPDFEAINMAANIMGVGFGGRLFKTLREKYSFTYTPYGYQTMARYANRFVAGSDVRSSATDSTIVIVKELMDSLTRVPASSEELNLVKQYVIGSYQMRFEQSEFVANLIQEADFYGIPLELVKSYPKRISLMSEFAIQSAAEKYMNPKNAFIVVVGAPEVREKLEKFGKIYDYNLDLEPLSGEGAKMEKVAMTPEELIAKYIDAIGGRENVEQIKSYIFKGNFTVSFSSSYQPTTGTFINKCKAPNKLYTLLDGNNFKQQKYVDGVKGIIDMDNRKFYMSGKELQRELEDDIFLIETQYNKLFKCEILGKIGNEILMKVLTNTGKEMTAYYDNDFLLTKIEYNQEMQGGTVMPITKYLFEYKKYEGVKFPTVIEEKAPELSYKFTGNYELNPALDDKEFEAGK